MKASHGIAILLVGISILIGLSTTILASNPDTATVTVNVSFAPPWIEMKWEVPDDDPIKPGVQIMPAQNSYRLVRYCAVVCDDNGANDIVHVGSETSHPTQGQEWLEMYVAIPPEFEECNVTIHDPEAIIKKERGRCELYTRVNAFDYNSRPGNYTINITATDSQGLNASSVNILEYLELVAIELDTNLLNFGTLNPGTASRIPGDTDFATLNASTIKSAGNVVIDLEISGMDLAGGGIENIIPISNLNTGFKVNDYSVDIPSFYDANLTPALPYLENFELYVPTGTAGGAYSGLVVLTAIKSV